MVIVPLFVNGIVIVYVYAIVSMGCLWSLCYVHDHNCNSECECECDCVHCLSLVAVPVYVTVNMRVYMYVLIPRDRLDTCLYPWWACYVIECAYVAGDIAVSCWSVRNNHEFLIFVHEDYYHMLDVSVAKTERPCDKR